MVPATGHPAILDRLLPAAFATALAVVILLAVRSRIVLYGDGAYLLSEVMVRRDFTDFDWARQFAQSLEQAPLVLAITAGVRDPAMLAGIFGATLFLILPLSLMLSFLLLDDRRLFVFPLAAAVAGAFNTTLFVISEAQTVAALFWPLLILLTRRRPLSPAPLAALVLLSLPLLRAYESMLLLGPLLAVVAVVRIRSGPDGPAARLVLALVAAWLLAAAALALDSALFPRDPANARNFAAALERVWGTRERPNLQVLYSVVLLALLGLGLVATALDRRLPRSLVRAGSAAFLAGAAGMALQPWLRPEQVVPGAHYAARVFNLALPLGLGVVHVAAAAGRIPLPDRPWTAATRLVLAFGILQLVWIGLMVEHWRHYAGLFQDELGRRRGLVPIEDTRLQAPVREGRPVAAFNWGWTEPTLSLFLAPGGRVRTIIAAPAHSPGWRPFDPSRPETLPELAGYGLDYGPYRAILASRRADAGPPDRPPAAP